MRRVPGTSDRTRSLPGRHGGRSLHPGGLVSLWGRVAFKSGIVPLHLQEGHFGRFHRNSSIRFPLRRSRSVRQLRCSRTGWLVPDPCREDQAYLGSIDPRGSIPPRWNAARNSRFCFSREHFRYCLTPRVVINRALLLIPDLHLDA